MDALSFSETERNRWETRIGRVVSVAGSSVIAIITINLSGSKQQLQIGSLVKIGTANATVFGLISALTIPLPAEDEAEGETYLMELILIGTGGCSAYDVVHILEKGREPVEDVSCDVTAERAETDPKVFTKIDMQFTVKGRGLDPKKVERAINLSVEKYCSASAMMAKTAELTHGFEVIDTTAG